MNLNRNTILTLCLALALALSACATATAAAPTLPELQAEITSPPQVTAAAPVTATYTPAAPTTTPTHTALPPTPTETRAPVQMLYPFRLGSTGADYGKDITTDAQGNVYVTGYFQGAVDFDPGEGIANRTAAGDPASPGAIDTFLAKYSREGSLLWVISIGGPGADMPHTVRIAPDGDVLLTGYFSSQVDFDPSAEQFTLNAGVGRDIFTARYNSDGGFQWARQIGDPEASPTDEDPREEGMDVTLDAAGNVYITGLFNGSVDLAAGAGSPVLVSSQNNSRDILVVSYSPEGAYRWGFAIGGTGRDHGHALRVGSDGSVYVAGMFSATVDFDPGAGVSSQTARGNWDAFLAKYDAQGNFAWAHALGGSGFDQVRPGAMEINTADEVFITGSFDASVDFDPDPDSNATLTSRGSSDIFLAQYGADGDYSMAFGMGGSGMDFAHRLALDSQGNIYLTGSFIGLVDFDPSENTANLQGNGSGGASDAFVAKYSPQGGYLWAAGFGGAVSGEGLYGLGAGISIDPWRNVVVAGRFHGNVDFDPGSGEKILQSAGGADVFVLKLNSDGLLAGSPLSYLFIPLLRI